MSEPNDDIPIPAPTPHEPEMYPFPLADEDARNYEPPELWQRFKPGRWQVVWSDNDTGWYIEGPLAETRADAIRAWNDAMARLQP